MIAKMRYYIYLIIPDKFVWKLIRTLPEIVNFTAKFFQGIDPLWEKDSEFKEIYKDIRKNIMLDKKEHIYYIA